MAAVVRAEDIVNWRPVLAGLCANLVGIGLARFAYTSLIPALISAHWFSPSATVYLGAANLAGYLGGALLARPIAARAGAATALRWMMVRGERGVLCLRLSALFRLALCLALCVGSFGRRVDGARCPSGASAYQAVAARARQRRDLHRCRSRHRRFGHPGAVVDACRARADLVRPRCGRAAAHRDLLGRLAARAAPRIPSAERAAEPCAPVSSRSMSNTA